MKKDLTLARLKNTKFPELYKRFILDIDFSKYDYMKLVSIAIILSNSDNSYVKNFGYRVMLMYCNRLNDYRPLYEIAINLGYIPVVKMIESSDKLKEYVSFFTEINSAYLENFHENNIYRSEEQQELFEFFTSKNKSTISIVAPTSYGKTELILALLRNNKNKRICIITPTKSLLGQTKMRILNDKIGWIDKIVVQPEMYNGSEESLVAVLTQERLLRLLKLNPELYFEFVIIDEAHGLLSNEDRSNLLASVLIILQKRNSETVFKFLTPFLSEPSNLKIRYTDLNIQSFKVTEYIKSEKFYIYNKDNAKTLIYYDQFIDEFYNIENCSCNNINFIINKSGVKNIVYLNKPKDIEDFAMEFSDSFEDINNKSIEKAISNIKEFIHPHYDLLKYLKKGIIYHHGSVPDSIRMYIEYLFSNNSELKYVITSSTLLEGVNLPAEKLFILDNRKGRSYLSPSNFKNLIGRICRFSEIFDRNKKNFQNLEPEIYLVIGKYYKKDINIEKFLKKTVKIDNNIIDEVNNVLLENTKIDKENLVDLNKSREFIENYEIGTIKDFKERKAETKVGQVCFLNNITEIDIFQSEEFIQEKINNYLNKKAIIKDTQELFDLINDVFFNFIIENDNNQNLLRFKHIETRNFYKMFLNWRIRGATFKEMIAAFNKHWEQLIKEGKDTLVYVERWGDTERNGFRKLWTDISKKTYKQKINLAIVRIKEEQDFLDNNIIKFVEVINDLNLMDDSFYLKIKYGTDDKMKILLIRNGLSLGLSKLIAESYSEFLSLNYDNNTVKFEHKLIDVMKQNSENEVLIFEMTYFCK